MIKLHCFILLTAVNSALSQLPATDLALEEDGSDDVTEEVGESFFTGSDDVTEEVGESFFTGSDDATEEDGEAFFTGSDDAIEDGETFFTGSDDEEDGESFFTDSDDATEENVESDTGSDDATEENGRSSETATDSVLKKNETFFNGSNSMQSGLETNVSAAFQTFVVWSAQQLNDCMKRKGTLMATATHVTANISAEDLLPLNTSHEGRVRQKDNSPFCKLEVFPDSLANLFVVLKFPNLNASFCGAEVQNHWSSDVLKHCDEAQTRVNLVRPPSDTNKSLRGNTVSLVVLMTQKRAANSKNPLAFTVQAEFSVHYSSPVKGWLQKKGSTQFRRQGSPKRWARLQVPFNHSAMVSVTWNPEASNRRLQCGSHRDPTLQIYYFNKARRKQTVYVNCNTIGKRFPRVFDVDVLYFYYPGVFGTTSSNTLDKVLKVQFSFHKRDAVLQQLPGLKWNCSVPHWCEFRHHFPCDLQTECRGGEDEAHCSYTGSCGRGFISTNSGCYAYVGSTDLSWTKANEYCRDRYGGYLASLNTAEEWTEITTVLKDAVQTEDTFIGLQMAAPDLPHMYRTSFAWVDGTTASFVVLSNSLLSLKGGTFVGAAIDRTYTRSLRTLPVTLIENHWVKSPFLCELPSPRQDAFPSGTVQLSSERPLRPKSPHYTMCPKGHLAQLGLACDPLSDCWAFRDDQCALPIVSALSGSHTLNSFACGCGDASVPYTVLCDGKSDCADGKDEDFCVFPPCNPDTHFQCSSTKQCVTKGSKCNGQKDCWDGSDESRCSEHFYRHHFDNPDAQVLIVMSSRGYLQYKSNDSQLTGEVCPETHAQCPANPKLCIPVFLVCNGVYDCPGRTDEAHCHSFRCPGFYRCRASAICVHPNNLCDGLYQCPQHDDELLCDIICPHGCTCIGWAFYCPLPVQAQGLLDPNLRYLNASGSGMTVAVVANSNLTLLVYLNLARCRLRTLDQLVLPNLHTLDVSDNWLTSLSQDHLHLLINLRALYLARNPLVFHRSDAVSPGKVHPNLQILDLSGLFLPEVHDDFFVELGFVNLRSLYLQFSGVQRMKQALQPLTHLRLLDLRGCPMTDFSPDVFQGLYHLDMVYSDNYKLCCPAVLPSIFNLNQCYAPFNEFSSCDSLLRANVSRLCLYLFALLAIVGNIGSLLYRSCSAKKREGGQACTVLVSHLCVSDFLMGVYLLIIGVADQLYRGTYLWEDVRWRHSKACQAAGFLSLLSCEVSAFIICLITLDRFLALRRPLSKLRLKPCSAHAVCVVVWLVGLSLAAVPLLPFTAHWNFYSQTGVCLPLPITRRAFAGHTYSFSIFIIVNFVLFLVIAPGQALIYRSVRQLRRGVNNNDRTEELAIARRLSAIAMTDFLCWFPIGLLGLLASIGMPIPGEVDVVAVIFVLPLNSALNPFLYTISMRRERRRRQKKCTCGKTQVAETEVDDGRSVVFTSTLDVV